MRTSTAVTVLTSLVSFVAGTILVILPWSSYWDSNYYFQYSHLLETILVNPVARSGVTALGIIDFLIGIDEVRRLRKSSDPSDASRPSTP